MNTHTDKLAAALRDSLSFLDILVDAALHGRKVGNPTAAHESIRQAHETLAEYAAQTAIVNQPLVAARAELTVLLDADTYDCAALHTAARDLLKALEGVA